MTTAKKSTAKKTTAKSSSTKVKKSQTSGAKVQTTSGAASVGIVPAGGIDPRLVEERERRRDAEKDIRPASYQAPTLDPKLAEIREQTIKLEKERPASSFSRLIVCSRISANLGSSVGA